MAKKDSPKRNEVIESKSNSKISQSDMPVFTLDKALEVPKALVEHYAGKSATPLQIAMALDVSPSSSSFRYLIGASSAYGLTSGSYGSSSITLEPLGNRIFKPRKEGDEELATREAFLRPRVIKEFFEKYKGASIPREDIAKNVLEDIGVVHERLDTSYDIIINGGERLKLITEHKGKKYISYDTVSNNLVDDSPFENEQQPNNVKDDSHKDESESLGSDKQDISIDQTHKTITQKDNDRLKKVFITHGKNTKFIDPIKKLLSFGELTPIVSVERTSISQPVPDKVMNDMRACGAAIIHVEDEMRLIDQEAKEQIIINPNVLIEIGAALALYGRRFILLVKSGVTLPSNLQGLFEVRYEGDALDGTATIKLLEAINDIKNQKLP